MWVVCLKLASVRLVEENKRKNEADLGFLNVLTFFSFEEKRSMEPDRRRE